MTFDEFVGQVLQIMPNATFSEVDGEVQISSGFVLTDGKLVGVSDS
jgi:hypothetical protein